MRRSFCSAMVFGCALFCVLSLPLMGRAEEEEKADKPAANTATPAQESTAELVRQLDADDFTQREEASRRLTELAAAAVPDLAKVAKGKSLEASSRAFAILKQFATGSDAASQTAAREALSKIAEQRDAAAKNKDDALAAAAARATDILAQSQQPPILDSTPPELAPPRIPFGGPRMIIRGEAVVGNRLSIKVVDGTREVDAEETQDNGQKRNVKIVSDPKSGIRMEVTTTKDGKPVTEKYAAKDADTLQKEHPEAFKLYQQYNGAGGQVQVGGGQIHIHGGRIEIGGGGLRVAPEPMKMEIDPNLDDQFKDIFDAIGRANGGLKRHHELLEEHRRRVEELRKQIEQAQPKRDAKPDSDDFFDGPKKAPAR